MGWTTITQPAVGGKITAAGFGDQTHDAVAELQLIADAKPGGDAIGLTTPAPASVSAGPTTIVSGPSSGRRLVKQLWLSGPAGATVTLTISGAAVQIQKISHVGGIFVYPVTIPLASGENLQATVTSGPIIFMPSYVDRADTLVDRLGLVSGSTSGTLITSSVSDRVITQLWVASSSLATASTARVLVGGTRVVDDVAMAAGSFFTLDDPVELPAGTAVTWAGDSTTAVSYMAAGRTA